MSGDDLVALVQGQEQLRRVASSYDGFADEPGLVSALAQSGATTSQIQSVGGFLRGMQLTSRVQLARESGVQIDLNDLDRAALAAIGTQFSDVDRQFIAAQSAAAQQPTHRSFWGQVGHIVNNATQLPVVKQIFHGLDRAADVVHMPFRAISSIGADNPFGLVVNPFTGGVHTNDQAARGLGELADTANAQGGGNGLLDNLAFLSHGNQVL